jgi:hypothetical protein
VVGLQVEQDIYLQRPRPWQLFHYDYTTANRLSTLTISTPDDTNRVTNTFSLKLLFSKSDSIAAIPYQLGTHFTTTSIPRSILKHSTTTMPYLSSTKPTVIHSSPKKERVVGFYEDPVEGVSRPVNTSESWAAYHFETHARKCAYCHNPYEVHRKREQLCDVGHRLAQEVTRFIYNKADGNTYSTTEEEHKPVRVEIPAGYVEVSSLLRAIERSIRHRSRRAFVSMDPHYYVAPRTPSSPVKRSNSVKPVKISHDSKPRTTQRPRSGEIVDWPQAQPKKRVLSEISNTANKRGSLYAEDLAIEARNKKHYAVEVREPSPRDHRSSGYYR